MHSLAHSTPIHSYIDQFVCRNSASKIQVAPPILFSTSLAWFVVVAVDNVAAAAAAASVFVAAFFVVSRILWALAELVLFLRLSFFNFRHHYSHWMLPQFIQNTRFQLH